MRGGHPSLTVRWVAAQRLRLERTRPSTPEGDVAAERRFYRSLAGVVSVPLGRAAALALRTQVIDAEVARALGRGTAQIVLVGASDDGRALRFGGGAVHWFEVDRPQAQADKRHRLGALGITATATTYIGLDLLTDDAADDPSDDLGAALQAAGHDAAAASLFVGEGIFDTLTLEASASACATLRDRAAAGSVLVASFSVVPEGSAPARVLRSATSLLRQVADEPPRHQWRPGDPQKLAVVTGWRVTHMDSSAERRLDPGAHAVVLVCEPDGAGVLTEDLAQEPAPVAAIVRRPWRKGRSA
jgi:methyltransferase (TIGR00027 family)